MKNDNSSWTMLLTGLVAAVLVVLVLYILTNSAYSSASRGGIGYITISATGTATAKPTMGTMYLTVRGDGKTGAAATANLSTVLGIVNSTLYGYVNGNLSMIQTTYYNLYNQTVNYPPGVAEPIYPYTGYSYNGFVAEEDLSVTVPNIQNVSGAIGALSQINGVEITGASASLSDAQITTLRSRAFSEAISNATSQAEALTGNATLSEQNITVNTYGFYPIAYSTGVAAGAAITPNTTANPEFYAGTDSVTGSVTVVFTYVR